ncbi:MAG: ABC transporter substrate-binding protein [Deinococcales bacterium]
MKKLVIFFTLAGLLGMVWAQAPRDTYVKQTLAGGPVSMDPARAYDSASGEILENIYETLYTYDGESIDTFKPALATSYSVSADGKTYTFTLRDGVKFHSGNMMSCKDVEWSFEYGLTAAHPEGAVMYLMGDQFLGRHDIDGSDPETYLNTFTYDMIANAVTCPAGTEGMTVQLNLVNPKPALIAILAYTAFSVMDSDYAKANGMWDGSAATWADWVGRDITQEFLHNHPSGTGAYKLVEWTDQATVLAAFDDYWGGSPALKNAVFQYVEEQSSRILALQQGDADHVILNDRASLVQLRGAPGVSILEDPNWSTTSVTSVFFNFNIDTSNNEDVGSGELGSGIPADFFADVNIRRGFSQLFDQQAFIDQLFEGQGLMLTVGMPSSFLGYDPNLPIRTLDLEAAERYFRAAFDGAVWEKGFEFTALYNGSNETRKTALEIIAENLEFLNPKFKMNVRSLPWPDYLARTGERKAPMFALGWGADYADPENFINTFYDDNGFYAARTSISVPEIQALIDQADAIADPVARAFIYKEIGGLHYEYAPIIAVPQSTPFMTVRSDLQGVYRNPMLSSTFFIKDISKAN